MSQPMTPSADRERNAATSIRVEVNGDLRDLPAASTILDLLETLDLGSKRVAVAVNRDVVIRSLHAETRLADGDHVEILEAVGGG